MAFAPSAGNRDSVQSLGSIAHLQYYFARTGLLDGKGAQLAKDERGKPGTGKIHRNVTPRIYVPSDGSPGPGSPAEPLFTDAEQTEEPMMLPPTVSTYSHRTQYIPPPPDLETLRHDLTKALTEAKKALQQITGKATGNEGNSKDLQDNANLQQSKSFEESNESASSQPSGWYEIQGLHILDVVTLAIRAAKMYYTSHEDPLRLYAIKSERQIREELLAVMDVLKKMAGRNFAGGMRPDEVNVVARWLDGIESFLREEKETEERKADERHGWTWLEGSWEGQERERERAFLNSFHNGEPLPEWKIVDPNDPQPTPFLDTLRTGLTLVYLHNALLRRSKRQFGDIRTFHTDLAKPYRCAENVRYWIKAAEIRWETKLKVNVSGVVNAKVEAYPGFDLAILQWSRAVREELTKEWNEASSKPAPSVAIPSIAESECESIDA